MNRSCGRLDTLLAVLMLNCKQRDLKYKAAFRKSEFEIRDWYCGRGCRNTCRGEPQAWYITAAGMRYSEPTNLPSLQHAVSTTNTASVFSCYIFTKQQSMIHV
jgi:hypothetical protein